MAETDLLERAGIFDASVVRDWLTRNGHSVGKLEPLVEGLVEAFRAGGLPLDRFTVGLPILHPQLRGMQFRWVADEGLDVQMFPATDDTLRQLDQSPVRMAYFEGKGSRYRIGVEPAAGEYPIIADLRRMGYADYAVFPLPYSDGSFKVMTLATRQPDGFAEADLAAAERLMPSVAPLIEVRSLRYTARSLLDVYIGPTAGGRVLDGEIRRGDGQLIQAVIWFSDLRGSTDLAESMAGPELIGFLNDFFGAVTGAITDHGGEVLKFIGDSVLAIFSCTNLENMGCQTANSAEAAARDAMQRVAQINAQANRPAQIDFGIALHVGEVYYGNVGGETRLDFTVIGPAVNLASRIESLCRDTGEPFLVSDDFASLSSADYRALGDFRFKGVDGWQTVYAPAGETS